jgi:hypothetical protein
VLSEDESEELEEDELFGEVGVGGDAYFFCGRSPVCL